MAKNPGKSKALVPSGHRRSPAKRRFDTATPVRISGDALASVLGSDRSAAKLVGSGGEMVREGDVMLVTGRAYATSDRIIPAEQVFYHFDSRKDGNGEWLGEADKVAWHDGASGYECIMLRDRDGGFLSGYVGVPRDHPLWGWEHKALSPDLGIEVHGGLTYSEMCEDGPSPAPSIAAEARRICHVPRRSPRYEPLKHATDYRAEDPHAWWFGFACNHLYDIVPGDHQRDRRFMSAETGAEYRDDTYVVREILNLARQLRAIADGDPVPAREGPPLPPVCLDPGRGGRW